MAHVLHDMRLNMLNMHAEQHALSSVLAAAGLCATLTQGVRDLKPA